MDYQPKKIPEGINTSNEHPLREFFVLVSGVVLAIVVLTFVLALSADFLIRYIPVEKENQWFANERTSTAITPELDTPASQKLEAEQALLQIIDNLRDQERPEYRFTLSLLDSEVPNAFVLPGGHIFVTSRLLELVDSENGLAMVLAHEMGHQYQRHPLRSLGRGAVIALALMVISGAESDALVESFTGSAALLTNLGFSREQEIEADNLAIELLVRHYGHASGSVEFFAAIKREPDMDSDTPGFFRTHPDVDDRIDLLRAHIRQTSGDKTPLSDAIYQYLDSIDKV
jgi:predicted Zn-dependent protease